MCLILKLNAYQLNMELLEAHFNTLGGNLTYDENTNSYEMFSNKIGTKKHINYLTFKKLFEEMGGLKQPFILESGIASHGTNSTYLFNEYVRKYGGFFWSVDTNKSLVEKHSSQMCPATQLICDDSVSFFTKWSKSHDVAHVIYLDSYDLDFYNPGPSGRHGLDVSASGEDIEDVEAHSSGFTSIQKVRFIFRSMVGIIHSGTFLRQIGLK